MGWKEKNKDSPREEDSTIIPVVTKKSRKAEDVVFAHVKGFVKSHQVEMTDVSRVVQT